jgi:glycosyltransferase involved in cell wall biosynthesis
VRVLHLQPAAEFGGAERQATYLVAGLPRHGIEVVPLVGPDRLIVDELARLGVRAIHHPGFPADEKAPRSHWQQGLLIERYVRAFFQLSRDVAHEVRRLRCDMVLASRPFSWVVGGRAGTRLGVPVVWRAGTLFTHWVQPAWLRLSEFLWPPRAVVCTSRAVRTELGRYVRAPLWVLHNGVDTARFSPQVDGRAARLALGVPPDAPVVAMAARLSPEKGLHLLVDACRALRARVPRVQVLIAGDSQWRERFDAACVAAGLDGTVHRLAFVRQIERVYAAADVVVLSSLTEGCSNVLLEAMAMGKPVVATAVDGTNELVHDGIDGLLVAPEPASLASRTAELLAAPERRRALGQAAAAAVARGFALEVQLGKLAHMLRAAAARA